MKELLFIPVFLFCLSSLLAQTEIDGEVSGVWTVEGSPYIVVDSTWIPEDEELVINSGVIVSFTDSSALFAFGSLLAHGSEDDSIYFQSIEDNQWTGIHLFSRQVRYEFEYCDISGCYNGLIANGETSINVSNSSINCNHIPLGVLDHTSHESENNNYTLTNSTIVGNRLIYLNRSRFTAVNCTLRTGADDLWGFTGIGSVELTGSVIYGEAGSLVMSGAFQQCHFLRPYPDFVIGIRVVGGNSFLQECNVEGSVKILSSHHEIHDNTIENNLRIESFGGVIRDCNVGFLRLDSSGDSIIVQNCIINENVSSRGCSYIEIHDCEVLGNHDPRHYTFLLEGPGRNEPFTCSLHHNIILGRFGIGEEIELDMFNNTVIASELDRPLIDASVNFGSLNFENNILLCIGENNGLYDPIGAVADNPNFGYNCIDGFEYFAYRNNELEFELDETNLFGVDPELLSLDELNPHLGPESPCIDAGNPDSPLDPDNTRADIGRYYYHQENGIANPNHNYPSECVVLESYPNPFNSITKIKFTHNYNEFVRIDLFNILGAHQKTLLDRFFPKGTYCFDLNAHNFPSGDYVVRFTGGAISKSKKITILK